MCRITGHVGSLYGSGLAVHEGEGMCLAAGADGHVRLFDLLRGGAPVKSWALPMGEKRYFMVPYWEDAASLACRAGPRWRGLGSVADPSLIFPPLWVGCRSTGVVYSLNLYRRGGPAGPALSIFG
jgi:hypothetical protein